jgi:hypothetical protein
MSDVTTALHEALEEEPPLGFEAAEIAARARRVQRRRRAMSLAGTATVAAAAVTGVVLAATVPAHPPTTTTGTAGGGTASSGTAAAGTAGGHATKLTLTALGQIATARRKASFSLDERAARTAVVEGISGPGLADLIEQETGVGLTGVQVSALPPTGELDLAAGIAVSGSPYLNVQVSPAGGLITATPTCAELSNLSSGDGDGYYGPCTIRRISDGSLLIVRSGTTAGGGFTMAQATLIRPDGSGVFAEDTNQAWAPQPSRRITAATKKAIADPPVVRDQPVLGAAAMSRLVQALAAQAAS